MNVFVLDGNENQAVAATRSLAAAGHRVEVGASTSWSKAGWSRHAAGSFQYSSPELDGHAFVALLAERAAARPGTFILPMTERTTQPISEHRTLLENVHARFVLPPHDVLMRAFDKHQTTALARSLGVAVPETHVIDPSADQRALAAGLRYPVVLKPRTSEERSTSGPARATGAPLYVRNPASFESACGSLRQRCTSALVQEFVPGSGAGYFALAEHGRIRAEFAHRRLRDVRPTGSGSAFRESVPIDPLLRDAARRLLEALCWHGVAMVEFRVRPDGEPVFMEINGRFWNSLALACYAGMDFPALLAEYAERRTVTAPAAYRTGVRCRWILGDVRHLAEVCRGAPAEFPGEFPSRLRALRDVLTIGRGTYHDNFQLADPWPEVGDWLHFLTRKLPAAGKRQPAARKPRTLRGALHVHSTYSDGEYTLTELRETLRRDGCRFACVTDHAEWLDDDSLRKYLAECAALSDDEFRFIPGLEYECERRLHIVGYGATMRLSTTDPDAVIGSIEAAGAFSMIAHPKTELFGWIEGFTRLPHAVEAWNSKYDGRYAPRAETFALIQRLQERKPALLACYGQDLHWKTQYRGLVVEIEAESNDRHEVLTALFAGAFVGVDRELRLPASGHVPAPLLRRFARRHRRSDRMRLAIKTVKRTVDRTGLALPPAIKAQIRRVF